METIEIEVGNRRLRIAGVDEATVQKAKNLLETFERNWPDKGVQHGELFKSKPAALAAYIAVNAIGEASGLRIKQDDIYNELFVNGLALGIFLNELGLSHFIMRDGKNVMADGSWSDGEVDSVQDH